MDIGKLELPVREGLILRFIHPGEAEMLYALVDKNRSRLRRWLNWVDAQTGPEVSREHIKKRLEHGKTGEALELGIYSGGELVGSIGFHHIAMENKKAAIGYWISQEYQGRGMMTACVRAFIDYGFKTLGLHRIRIQCNMENTRSAAIPERLGFTFEGIAREDEFLYDHFESSRVYSILAHEWV